MSSYTITTTLNQPYPAAVEAVRTALGDQLLGPGHHRGGGVTWMAS